MIQREMDQELIKSWQGAAANAEVDAAIRSLHADIEAATEMRRPRCDKSGRCCHFEKFGHRMYLTGLETSWFLNQLQAKHEAPSLSGRGSGGGSRNPNHESAHPHPTRLSSTLSPDEASSSQADPPTLRGKGNEDGSCPFLDDGLCSVHDIRPMGCRIFFCDPTSIEWQNDLYERAHKRIAALHEEHGIPYRYGEWREMLRSCGSHELNGAARAIPDDRRSEVSPFVHVRIDR